MEITTLKYRYKTFREKQESKRKALLATKAPMFATLVDSGIAGDFSTNELNTVLATNIRVAFKNLLSCLQVNKNT